MTSNELLQNITSRDTFKVWKSACEIIDSGQDIKKIQPLIEHLPKIRKETKGLDMGGGFAPNQRFINFAIKTIQFHKKGSGCTCNLYVERYTILNKSVSFEGFNPKREAEAKNIEILKTAEEDGWVDHYIVRCGKCQAQFKVDEREGHYTWWAWSKV